MARSGDIIQASDFNDIKTDLDALNTKVSSGGGGGKTLIQVVNDHAEPLAASNSGGWYDFIVPADGEITKISLIPIDLQRNVHERPKYDLVFSFTNSNSSARETFSITANYYTSLTSRNFVSNSIINWNTFIQGNSTQRQSALSAFMTRINNSGHFTATDENDAGTGDITITVTPTYQTLSATSCVDFSTNSPYFSSSNIPTNWSRITRQAYNFTGTQTGKIFVNDTEKGSYSFNGNSTTLEKIDILGSTDLSGLSKNDIIRITQDTSLASNNAAAIETNVGFTVVVEMELD